MRVVFFVLGALSGKIRVGIQCAHEHPLRIPFVPLETTHFGLVTARAEVQAHIRQWVAKLPSE